MRRCWLKGQTGDALHAVSPTAGGERAADANADPPLSPHVSNVARTIAVCVKEGYSRSHEKIALALVAPAPASSTYAAQDNPTTRGAWGRHPLVCCKKKPSDAHGEQEGRGRSN